MKINISFYLFSFLFYIPFALFLITIINDAVKISDTPISNYYNKICKPFLSRINGQ